MKVLLRILREQRVASGWLLLMALMPLASSALGTWLAYGHLGWLQQAGWPWQAAAYLLASVLMAGAVVPTTFMALLGGYVWGWASMPWMVAAYLCAAWLCYLAARLLDGGRLADALLAAPEVAPHFRRLRQAPFRTVAYTKLSPLLPFGVSNWLLAFLDVPLRPFLWGSLAGMLPRTALATAAGWQAQALGQALQEARTPAWGWALLAVLTAAAAYGLWQSLRMPEGGNGKQ
jgi:uncharacterized membrane protein YdjX (TVP38/TMEM64 family)